MKKIILAAYLIIAAGLINAQSPAFEWAKGMGNEQGHDEGYSVAVDASGNVYTTGYFHGDTADFDPGPGIFNLIAPGSEHIFISKLDSDGNFVWAKSIAGSANQFGRSIKTDASGFIYITGNFEGTVDFDPGVNTFNLTSLMGTHDIFILKLDASGNFVWVKSIGGIFPDQGESLAFDNFGNMYVTGSFTDTVDFDPGPGIFNLTAHYDTHGHTTDIFILKLNPSGNFLWAKNMGGGDNDIAYSITTDASGSVYTTGWFKGLSDFDPGTGTFNLSPAGYDGAFISKLDDNGNFVWAKNVNHFGYSIVVDASGNVYIAGSFKLTVDFDPGPGTFNLTSPGTAGKYDIFVLKLDVSGNFVWAVRLGGTSNDQYSTLTLDASGDIYVAGQFMGTADFDPGPGTYNLTNGNLFVCKLNNSGNFIWAKNIGENAGGRTRAILVDSSNNIYSSGYYVGSGDFDPGPGTYNLSALGGLNQVLVHKMSQCTPPSATITPGGATTFCSGGNVTLNANSGAGFSYQWKKNGTDISGATASTYSATSTGSYSVVITNACGTAASSSVSVTINSLPSATITPAGPTTFCSGGSVVLSVPSGANKTYQWKKGANLISGATSSSYTATTGGNYKMIVTNTVTGCSKTTNSATVVTVNALPAATITPQGPTTFCAGGSVVLQANTGGGLTYKWKKGSNFISGATLSNYTATAGGNYRVQVTNSNGCSKTSALVAVSVPCKEGESISLENNFDVTVFPNPSSGTFLFEIENANDQKISFRIYDVIGKTVLTENIYSSQLTIHHSQLASGIYSVEIVCGKNKKVLKLVKTN